MAAKPSPSDQADTKGSADPGGSDVGTSRPNTIPSDKTAAGGLPFPEVRDSLSLDRRFDVPFSDRMRDSLGLGDSAGKAFARPADSASHPPLGRADAPRMDGIRIKARPRNLPGMVRVLISKSARTLPIYSLGEVEIRHDGAGNGKPKILRGRITVSRDGSEFEIAQSGRKMGKAAARRLRLVSLNPYNLLEVGGTVYRGHLEVIAGQTGELMAVNVLGVEDYLRGVLPYELGTVDRDALEALKAMAVAARTYAYKRMLASPLGDFHLHSDVSDQVYKGVKGEYLLSDRAIRETRGMILTYKDSLAQCYYHSTCGGRTASRHELWGGDSLSYLVSRPDLEPGGARFCKASKYSEWRQEWTLPQLAGILNRNLASAGVAGASGITRVTGLDVLSRAACGRIRVLRISTDKGQFQVKGDKVRWALRPAGAEERILPSAWFDVKVTEGKALVQGRAFGHGIGLCQMGTIARARAGQDFRKIMLAYYAGTDLVEFR